MPPQVIEGFIGIESRPFGVWLFNLPHVRKRAANIIIRNFKIAYNLSEVLINCLQRAGLAAGLEFIAGPPGTAAD
jgi:hypothetical protein